MSREVVFSNKILLYSRLQGLYQGIVMPIVFGAALSYGVILVAQFVYNLIGAGQIRLTMILVITTILLEHWWLFLCQPARRKQEYEKEKGWYLDEHRQEHLDPNASLSCCS
jgi:hypothetical protein